MLGKDAEKIATYKVEPYVMSADIYAQKLHVGRGGWTWYTGSAGWMYQFVLESFIGLNKVGEKLMFTPCIPIDWKEVKIDYRYLDTTFHITYKQITAEKIKLFVDDIQLDDEFVTLIDDNKDHTITVIF